LDLVEENSLPRAPRPSPHPHVIGVSGPYPADLVEITSVSGCLEDVDVAAADFEGEEDVDPFEGDRAVDMEKPTAAWSRLVLAGIGAMTYRSLAAAPAESAAA